MATALRHDLQAEMRALGERARGAARVLATAPRAAKDRALHAAAAALRARQDEILAANRRDLAAAEAGGLRPALLDRLALDARRVEAMAAGLEAVAALADPVGDEIARWSAPQRPRHRARAGPARGDRDHLRIPPQRHRGRRRALPQGRQRGDPARRLGELPLLARDPRLPRRRPASGRAARGGDPEPADHRSRRGRHHADDERADRRHRAARRAVA